jgi:hypothetical protein
MRHQLPVYRTGWSLSSPLFLYPKQCSSNPCLQSIGTANSGTSCHSRVSLLTVEEWSKGQTDLTLLTALTWPSKLLNTPLVSRSHTVIHPSDRPAATNLPVGLNFTQRAESSSVATTERGRTSNGSVVDIDQRRIIIIFRGLAYSKAQCSCSPLE